MLEDRLPSDDRHPWLNPTDSALVASIQPVIALQGKTKTRFV